MIDCAVCALAVTISRSATTTWLLAVFCCRVESEICCAAPLVWLAALTMSLSRSVAWALAEMPASMPVAPFSEVMTRRAIES